MYFQNPTKSMECAQQFFHEMCTQQQEVFGWVFGAPVHRQQGRYSWMMER